MFRFRLPVSLVVAVLLTVTFGMAGCINVKAPENVTVGGAPRGRQPIDTSRLPPTRSHEEARQKLAEAYERIGYLEDKVRDLEEDKDKLKDKCDEYKRKYERAKDRYDD
ncbi:MAG: hypothetical protein JXQ75_08170 [Phycisphaerae bacterium]|nr:hypothetical protein [Phycisphaerae bacterium]